MIFYSPNAIALDTMDGKPTRLFTYGNCHSKEECEVTFKNWEEYGYRFLCTWIDVRNADTGRKWKISFKTYRKNLL